MARKRNGNKPPRSQGPAPGGKRKGGPPAKSFPERSGKLAFLSPAEGAHGHGYSLAEEARNTAHNRRGKRGVDGRLRFQPVTFISAGVMDPLKELEVEQKEFNETLPAKAVEEIPLNTVASDNVLGPREDVKAPGVTTNEPTKKSVKEPLEEPSVPSFTFDLAGDRSLRPAEEPTPTLTVAESHHDSDSSEEVILFKGRDASRRSHSPAPPSYHVPDQQGGSKDTLELRAIDRELRLVEKSIQKEELTSTRTNIQQQIHETAAEVEDHISLSTTEKRGRRPRKAPPITTASDEEAAIIADYIANMQDDDEEDEDEEEDKHAGIGSQTFNALRDLGGTDSDAVPGGISSEEHSSDGSSEDEIDDEDPGRGSELADERMARILAKQEELGLGGDDIMLFDDADSDGDNDWQTAPRTTPRRKKKGSSKQARIIQKKGQYLNATQMADAFDDLDFMDWHRPSLNNYQSTPKSFNVSDSELEEAMNIAWQKDRLKKAEKKKAREELRSQGLLGKNVNPDDLRVKYRGGMSIDDLADELESFLLGSQQQLSLPPLDKRSRMNVHLLANKLKIKSQSAGKGNGRYTVLYRTRATLPFDQVVLDRALARTHQTWFSRADVDEEIVNQERISKRGEPRKARGKHSHTYREGDVVGQHAAELGAANKGRTMLEKMGWTKGMGLGSGENKGITVPLMQVVKKTKAGLGDA